jgi:hypothetical protein
VRTGARGRRVAVKAWNRQPIAHRRASDRRFRRRRWAAWVQPVMNIHDGPLHRGRIFTGLLIQALRTRCPCCASSPPSPSFTCSTGVRGSCRHLLRSQNPQRYNEARSRRDDHEQQLSGQPSPRSGALGFRHAGLHWAGLTRICRTGVLASVITASISTPDIRMRTGSPTRAVGAASRTCRSLGVFSQSN